MRIYLLALSFFSLSITGCSVATYSHKLQDVENGERVGVSFDNSNLDSIRVYPNTKDCINIDDKENGYTNNAIGFQTKLNNKILGFPEIPETSVMRREFWVNATNNIAIRMIRANGEFDTVTFKPTIGSYYYVTGEFISQYSPRALTVLEVYKTEKGYYDKKPVKNLKLSNCEDGSFRMIKF
ncbi:TPA: hypothetical protein ACGCBI_000501 [Serratia marcescens]